VPPSGVNSPGARAHMHEPRFNAALARCRSRAPDVRAASRRLTSRELSFTRAVTEIHSARSAIHFARSAIHFARSAIHFARSAIHFAPPAFISRDPVFSFAHSRSQLPVDRIALAAPGMTTTADRVTLAADHMKSRSTRV
jgi:hypothetical protein